MAEFGLIRPFDIDNGELDGLRPQEIFVLGYELAQVDQKLSTGKAFEQTVHAENAARIRAQCVREWSEFSLTWMEGDVSETWMVLRVAQRCPNTK